MNRTEYINLYASLLNDANALRAASDAEHAAMIARRLIDAAHEKIDGSMPNGASMIMGLATFILSMSTLGRAGIFTDIDDAEIQFCTMVHVICISALLKLRERESATLQ